MYEIDFMAVGESHGDAICMRYGVQGFNQVVNVIDGGYTEIGADIVAHIQKFYGTDTIDNVVLTHADDDHARGLVTVMENCIVGALRMNRPWRFASLFMHNHHGNYGLAGFIQDIRDAHPYLVELEEIALSNGVPIHDVFQGDTYGAMTVLAPSRERYIELLPLLDKTPEIYGGSGAFRSVYEKVRDNILNVAEKWDVETLQENPPATSPSNETSLVQMFRYDNYSALFTGDVGPQGLADAAGAAYNRGVLAAPNLVQIPHQGSRRNVTPRILNTWLGQPVADISVVRGRAFCMVGEKKSDHPRKIVSNAFTRRGYVVEVGRGSTRCFSNIERQGWGPVGTREPFWTTVEDYS